MSRQSRLPSPVCLPFSPGGEQRGARYSFVGPPSDGSEGGHPIGARSGADGPSVGFDTNPCLQSTCFSVIYKVCPWATTLFLESRDKWTDEIESSNAASIRGDEVLSGHHSPDHTQAARRGTNHDHPHTPHTTSVQTATQPRFFSLDRTLPAASPTSSRASPSGLRTTTPPVQIDRSYPGRPGSKGMDKGTRT